MSEFFQLLATFKPPDMMLRFIRKSARGQKISDESARWLSIWENWPAVLLELQALATDDDERALREIVALFGTGVVITELPKRLQDAPQQATLIEVKEKPTI